MAPTLYRIILQVDNLDEERSFYVHDPWGNGLCFVDENTLFTGK
jgi:hypothetical protein